MMFSTGPHDDKPSANGYDQPGLVQRVVLDETPLPITVTQENGIYPLGISLEAMKLLLLLRHAKSSWKEPDLADHDRPLNPRGKRDAPRMGRFIRQQRLVPDGIICSTAKRARKTAEHVARSCGFDGPVEFCPALYHGGPRECLEILRTMAEPLNRVMLIGHNPALEEFLEDLTGQGESLPTAALAAVEIPIDDWRSLTGQTKGRLAGVWRPKELADDPNPEKC